MHPSYTAAFEGQPEAFYFFMQGYHAHMRGQWERAVEFHQKSIESYPTAQAYTFLGWSKSHLGDLEDAILQCKNAIFIQPGFGNPYNDIGVYLIQKEQPEPAIEWLEKALGAPDYESYYFPHINLARIHFSKKRFEKALKHFKAALNENPRDDNAREMMEWIKETGLRQKGFSVETDPEGRDKAPERP